MTVESRLGGTSQIRIQIGHHGEIDFDGRSGGLYRKLARSRYRDVHNVTLVMEIVLVIIPVEGEIWVKQRLFVESTIDSGSCESDSLTLVLQTT